MKYRTMTMRNSKKALERPRYFPRQLMTPEEMMLEQNYFLEKLRRHNRLLHGWSKVCGLEVTQKMHHRDENSQLEAVPWVVEVSPGYALDPLGNEIFVPNIITFDLRRESLTSCEIVQGKEDDPWCSDVLVEPNINQEIYLAICYEECPTRPVRVTASGCNCDTADCENSRVRDGYRLLVLDAWPEIYNQELYNLDCLDVDNHLLNSPIVLAKINEETVENVSYPIKNSQMGELTILNKKNYELIQENEELRGKSDISSSITEYVAKLTETIQQNENLKREIDSLASFNKDKVVSLAKTIDQAFNIFQSKLDHAIDRIKFLERQLQTKDLKDIPPFDLESIEGVGTSYAETLRKIGIDNASDLLIHTKDMIINKLREKKLRIRKLDDILTNARKKAVAILGSDEALEAILAQRREENRDD